MRNAGTWQGACKPSVIVEPKRVNCHRQHARYLAEVALVVALLASVLFLARDLEHVGSVDLCGESTKG